jgi:hypothetical protein
MDVISHARAKYFLKSLTLAININKNAIHFKH